MWKELPLVVLPLSLTHQEEGRLKSELEKLTETRIRMNERVEQVCLVLHFGEEGVHGHRS